MLLYTRLQCRTQACMPRAGWVWCVARAQDRCWGAGLAARKCPRPTARCTMEGPGRPCPTTTTGARPTPATRRRCSRVAQPQRCGVVCVSCDPQDQAGPTTQILYAHGWASQEFPDKSALKVLSKSLEDVQEMDGDEQLAFRRGQHDQQSCILHLIRATYWEHPSAQLRLLMASFATTPVN